MTSMHCLNLHRFDASSDRLDGTIPTTLGLLTGLASLELSENIINFTLPSELGNLSELVWNLIAFNNTRLRGTIPATLGLDLGDNSFTRTIFSKVGNLSSLYTLHLSGNHPSGSLPSEIGKLSNLSSLELHDNSQLAGTIPTEYTALPELNYFSMHHTGLTGSLDSLFCGAPEAHVPSLFADCLAGNAEIYSNDRAEETLVLSPDLGKAEESSTADGEQEQNVLNTCNEASKQNEEAKTKAILTAHERMLGVALDTETVEDVASKKTINDNIFRVIEPTNVPQLHSKSNHASTVGNDTDKKMEGLRHIPPTNTHGLAVATEVLYDNPEDTERMATEIADLQAKLREHDTRDIIDSAPVTDVEAALYGNGRSKILRRLFWILLGLSVVGGVVAVTLAVKNKPAALPSVNPTMSPATLPEVTDSPLALSSMPTSSLYLNANPDSPQAQAFQWLSIEDDYSVQPQIMSTEEIQERYALVVLYYATFGSLWNTTGAYFLNSTSSVCAWRGGEYRLIEQVWVFHDQGVFCNSDNRVNEIWMPYCKLLGKVPSEFSLLSSLESLQLSWNQLTGNLPHNSIPASSTSIDLSHNYLSGTLPPMPASLISIDLSYNYLSGTLPSDWVETMTNLHELTLYSNDLKGLIPPKWGDFDQLEFLDVGSNDLSGPVPTTIGQMTRLTSLYLVGNVLMTGGLPSELGELQRLQELWASCLGGSLPSEIGNLRNLSLLDINSSTGFIPTEIGLMTNLEEVVLHIGQLSGTLPSEIGSLSKLDYFSVSRNPGITGTVPSEFRNLSSLNTLNLFLTSITGSLDAMFCDDGIENFPSYYLSIVSMSEREIPTAACSIPY
eukprot:Nitzschia sp. Nitz4//scaffold214_size40253//1387//19208//NITZ4_007584-RA/size40253-snap-gene-0.62-mRNA-1//-1//CDS//3329542090//2562//frame0